MPSDSRFFFGREDGTLLYITTHGTVWELPVSGVARLAGAYPTEHGTVFGLDAVAGCTWTWQTPTTEKLNSIAYQQQITGLPYGFECVFPDGTKLEGFDHSRNTFLEAKAHYAWAFDGNGDVMPWTTGISGQGGWEDQMERQVRNANGRMVEWHFADEVAAHYMELVIASNSLLRNAARAIWTPAR